MKISVIVPVYNRLSHLRSQFLCLLNQTIQPYELIIADDGSSEKVLDYIGDLLERAQFNVKHVYHDDKGFRKTRALNNGVLNSDGDYLVFCDQDLIFGEDFIENIIKKADKKYFLHNRPIDTSQEQEKLIMDELNREIPYEEIFGKLPKEFREREVKKLEKDKISRFINRLGLKKRGIKLVGMSYSLYKENYLKVNGYDEKYQGWGFEDDDFGNRLYVLGLYGMEQRNKESQIHLWHYNDPTKKESANDSYYREIKRIIFSKKQYKCEYGIENRLENDEIKVNILKRLD